ncbi:multisubstrate pseudouridine synthase 7 [Diutina catenulata]
MKRTFSQTTDAVGDAKRSCLSVEERASKVVQETDVGITTFVNEANRDDRGFSGIIKTLYSDFQVNEITPSGDVVHLRDEGINVPEKERKPREPKQEATGGNTQPLGESRDKYDLSDEDRSQLLADFVTEDELEQIEKLFTTGDKMETTSKFDDKQKRTQLHQLLRKAFNGKLDTVTTPENTFKIQLARKAPKRRGQPHPQESMNHVDENGVHNYGAGPYKHYLHFTVYKENRETMEIASTMSKLLRVSNKMISFAGTKDRRGVTTQRFSINRGKVLRVNSLNKGLKQAVLGGFSYEDSALTLGDLSGNEFVVTIRDIRASNPEDDVAEVVAKCFQSLKDKGFINYFGLQRFGSFSISTHQLGIHILKEQWAEAAELILSEQEVMAPMSIEARKIWAETRDPQATLDKMPTRFSAEVSILRQLVKEPQLEDKSFSSHSYFLSLMQIPKNLRLMYAHAYQSYVWNVVASKRFEKYGLTVQEGDLVFISDKDTVEPTDEEEFEEDAWESKNEPVRHLSAADIASGKYSIYDVILPTPGFKIEYPTKMLETYKEVMAADGLDPENMVRKVKEFSLTGSYRHVMVKPKNMSYEMVKYDDNMEPLVKTDLELLKAQTEDKPANFDSLEGRITSNPEGTNTAVVLKMQLGVSTYATMALREFMKIDTSRFGFVTNVPEKKVEVEDK